MRGLFGGKVVLREVSKFQPLQVGLGRQLQETGAGNVRDSFSLSLRCIASPASARGDAHAAAAKESVKAAPKSSAATIGAVSLAAAGIGYWFWKAEKEGQHSQGQTVPKQSPDSRPGVASAPPHPLPDFSIKLHTGDSLGKEQLLGDFALLYFGSLANASHTSQSLDYMMHIVQQQDRRTNMHMLQPVFLALDQESATPEKLKDFMGKWDKPGQTGLRLAGGTGPDVRKVADAAFSHSAKAGEQGHADADYSDTGLLFLVHPDGNIILQFSADADAAPIVDTIAEQAKDYKALHPGWHGPKAIKERHA